MSKPFPGSTPALLCLGLLLAGCGGVNLWPFGDGETSEPSRAPANATAYQCEGGKRLYVRLLEDGAAAWAILPEREIRLDKAPSGSGTTYSYRNTRLEINGNEAVLFEGTAATLAGCKAGGG